MAARHAERLDNCQGFFDFLLSRQGILVFRHMCQLAFDEGVDLLLGKFFSARLFADALQRLPLRVAKSPQIRCIHLRVAVELPEIAIDKAAVQVNAQPLRQGLGKSHLRKVVNIQMILEADPLAG